MKRLLLILLAACMLLSFVGCTKYKPVKSTDEEAATVLRLSADGAEYNVAYELYRTMFLQYKSEIDGGDESVWQSEEKDEYAEQINSIIFERIAEIYSVFHLCKELGIDVYSKLVNETIEDYVKASVEGGSVDSMIFEGFGGDYDAYLEHLRKMGMNYSVQELLFRYSVASELLDEHYGSDLTDGGELPFTRDDVRTFYFSEDCVRVLQAYLSTATEMDASINTEERVARVRDGIAAQTSERDVGTYMISQTLAGESLRNGVTIGRHSLDPMYYSALTEAAFALSDAQTSEPIKIVTGVADGYYILYRAEKSDEHFSTCYAQIEDAYVQHTLGAALAEAKAALLEGLTTTEIFAALDYAAIRMD